MSSATPGAIAIRKKRDRWPQRPAPWTSRPCLRGRRFRPPAGDQYSHAAIRPHKPFTEVTRDDWELVRGVVLDGAFYCAHAAIPSYGEERLREGGVLHRGRRVQGLGPARSRVRCQDGDHRSGQGVGLGVRAQEYPGERHLSGPHRHHQRPDLVSPGRDTRDVRHPGGPPGFGERHSLACLFLVTDECGSMTGQTLHVNGGPTSSRPLLLSSHNLGDCRWLRDPGVTAA